MSVAKILQMILNDYHKLEEWLVLKLVLLPGMYRPLMLNTRESAIGTPWMSHTLNNHIQKS